MLIFWALPPPPNFFKKTIFHLNLRLDIDICVYNCTLICLHILNSNQNKGDEMKISKIACVALLGASFAISGAFAEESAEVKAYDLAKENQVKKADAFNKVMDQVKILQGIQELKDWDGTNTNADAQKKRSF